MGDQLSMLRRDVLELGGAMAAMSGCLSSNRDESTATAAETDVDGPEEVADVTGFDG